jgi:hypothetical protein
MSEEEFEKMKAEMATEAAKRDRIGEMTEEERQEATLQSLRENLRQKSEERKR